MDVLSVDLFSMDLESDLTIEDNLEDFDCKILKRNSFISTFVIEISKFVKLF